MSIHIDRTGFVFCFVNLDVHMSYLAADILVSVVLWKSWTNFEVSSITWSIGIFRFANLSCLSSSGALPFPIPCICDTVWQLDSIWGGGRGQPREAWLAWNFQRELWFISFFLRETWLGVPPWNVIGNLHSTWSVIKAPFSTWKRYKSPKIRLFNDILIINAQKYREFIGKIVFNY